MVGYHGQTCQVFLKGEYVGRAAMVYEDWQNCPHGENWRDAALNAAKRTFGDKTGYHVVESVTPEDMGWDV